MLFVGMGPFAGHNVHYLAASFTQLCSKKRGVWRKPQSDHFVQLHKNRADHPCLQRYPVSVITIIVELDDET